MITLFTAPKPFLNPHIITIQRNALANWKELHPEIEVFVVGDEEGIVETADEFGLRSISVIRRNELGTPLLDAIFQSVRERASFDLLCYTNADILFLDNFLPAVERLKARFEQFLAVGQRWDVDIESELDFSGSWSGRLQELIDARGTLHRPMGSDYFVFPRGQFTEMPPFALGRAGWDNWMIYAGRHAGYPVVDATGAITIIHQNHDYHHLPGGKPHYRLPESDENVRLAGGREVMFTLPDADWKMDQRNFVCRTLKERGGLTALEKDWIAMVGASKRASFIWMLFHPVKTVRYYSRAVLRRIRRLFRS